MTFASERAVRWWPRPAPCSGKNGEKQRSSAQPALVRRGTVWSKPIFAAAATWRSSHPTTTLPNDAAHSTHGSWLRLSSDTSMRGKLRHGRSARSLRAQPLATDATHFQAGRSELRAVGKMQAVCSDFKRAGVFLADGSTVLVRSLAFPENVGGRTNPACPTPLRCPLEHEERMGARFGD